MRTARLARILKQETYPRQAEDAQRPIHWPRRGSLAGRAAAPEVRRTVSASETWTPAGPDIQSVHARYPDPLRALAEAHIPAIVLRRAYEPAQCAGLIGRFVELGLMLAPEEHARTADPRTRIDIGSSLNNRGGDKDEFLQHAAGTRERFRTL